ncbi:hypothetical protein KFK09_006781 [Dendrobium nobile]|uniref:Uncharacterized protein n=1 Tax=Dendrobium nobile TaxID=94219 RepID=A0A8T3BUG2_DENNO|nr:hypothetical protein KFK09_006781 [Dendrobium nobile]
MLITTEKFLLISPKQIEGRLQIFRWFEEQNSELKDMSRLRILNVAEVCSNHVVAVSVTYEFLQIKF